MEVAITFIMLLCLLAIGLPIGVVLFVCGVTGVFLLRGWSVALASIATVPYGSAASADLIVVPMFILMGMLAFSAKISSDAYDVAYRWIGRLPGGVAMATVGACALFAATSGSSIATSATVGKIAIPEMRRFKYRNRLAAGVVASGGLLGIMIPPSIPMVIYGIITDTHIGACLVAGFFPGIMTAFIFMGALYVIARTRAGWAPRGEAFSWKERLTALPKVTGVLVLFLTIVGGIYLGFFTVSEAAAAGASMAFVIAVIRGMRWKGLLEAIKDSVKTTAMIFMIVIGAFVFGHFVAISGVAAQLVRAILDLPLPVYATLSLIIFMYIPLGMFLDPLSIMLLTLPFVFPAIIGLGFNAFWFAVICVKMNEIGNLTPPFGLNVFVIQSIAPDIPLEEVFKGIGVFLILDLITLVVLVVFPEISTYLPSLMYQ